MVQGEPFPPQPGPLEGNEPGYVSDWLEELRRRMAWMCARVPDSFSGRDFRYWTRRCISLSEELSRLERFRSGGEEQNA